MNFILNIYNNKKAVIGASQFFKDNFSNEEFILKNIKVSQYAIPTNGYQRIILISPNEDRRELKVNEIQKLKDLIKTLSGIKN
jgi:malate/lactate dehydrogenase